MSTDETYLGDGLYASVEGDMIKLRAPRETGDHVTCLESHVLWAFLQFLKAQGVELAP